MTDQQRFDSIAALGSPVIQTPNFDRLARRGISFDNAYSPCPVCVPARYIIRTGRDPFTTGVFRNASAVSVPGAPDAMEERCGPYLARRMRELGYRTFGVGKFHTRPFDEDLGFDVHMRSEETFGGAALRQQDAYYNFIHTQHPEFAFIEQPHGERTDMYYMPQMSPLPAALTVESWVADRAVEQIAAGGDAPWFGFVSFIGPHPPLAPPVPFNRMYNPDHMPRRILGDIALDHMDEYIPWMNYGVWSEDVDDVRAAACKARYYGEISYIDGCLGRILDAVDASGSGEDTLICFFSDHGDHLGDHHAWQKESYFEASTHIPFLLSWPARLEAGMRRSDLVSLVDLFGIATSAAGAPEMRDGHDVLGGATGAVTPRETLFGWYGDPGTPLFKFMVRRGDWKYIYLANGGREQLFNLRDDPNELQQRVEENDEVADELSMSAMDYMRTKPAAAPALEGDDLRFFEFESLPLRRIKQFDQASGVTDFAV
jgi:choline-sulfatase